jgi:beta-fructofuranosidase
MLAFDDRWTWDFWLADDGSRYHVFYLQAPKSLGDPDRRHDRATVGHAVSDDLVHWIPLPDALGPGPPGTWDDVAIWTGSVVRRGDGWAMAYTGRSTRDGGRIQRIGLATSPDLVTWTKDPDNPRLEADGRWYERRAGSPGDDEAWRDPWLFADPDGDGFHALVTARACDGEPATRGVVAHARSADLHRWTMDAPIAGPGEFWHLEVPQVERVDGQWVLVFSCAPRDVGPARRIRRPGERGGAYWVTGPTALGPFDVLAAQAFPNPDLYSMRLVRRRDGSWAALGFIDVVDGAFVGALSDPVDVPFDWLPAPRA